MTEKLFGGGGDAPPDKGEYFHPDADSLFGRVDFAAIIANMTRGALLAFLSVFAGIVLAFKQAIGNVVDAIGDAWSVVWSTVISFPVEVQRAAVEAAVNDLVGFDVFAGPLSLLILLAMFGFLAVMVYMFTGVGGD